LRLDDNRLSDSLTAAVRDGRCVGLFAREECPLV